MQDKIRTVKIFLKSLFSPPVFGGDSQRTRLVRVLHTVLLLGIFIDRLAIPLIYFFAIADWHIVFFDIALLAFMITALFIVRSGSITTSGILILITIWIYVTGTLFFSNGLYAPTMPSYFLLALVAGILFGKRGAIWGSILIIATTGFVLYAQFSNWFPSQTFNPLTTWIVFLANLTILVALVFLSTKEVSSALQKYESELESKKIIEDALQRERAILTQIMETSPVGIVMLDRVGKIVFANLHAEKVLGLSKTEITSRMYDSPSWKTTDFDGNPFPTEQLPFSRMQQSRSIVYDVKHAIQWPDGGRRYLSVNAAPLFTEQDTFDGMVATIEDLTERQLAAKALKETAETLRALVESSPLAIMILDRDGRVRMWNPAAEKMLGWTEEELIGHALPDLPTEMKKDFLDSLRDHIDADIHTNMEVQRTRKDGTLIDLSISTAPLRDQAGKIYATMGIVSDISERKKVERIQMDQEKRIRAIIDHAPFGAHMYELKPDNRLVFVGSNLSAEAILGVDHSQYVGKTIEEDFPDLPPEIPEAYRQTAKTGKSYIKDQVDYDAQGIRGAFEIYAFQTEQNRATVFFRDITERKKAEEALRLSEEQYRLLFEGNPHPMWLYDRDTLQFLAVNDAMIAQYGYSREECLQMTVKEIRPPEDIPLMLDRIANLQDGISYGGIWRHRRKDRSILFVEITGHITQFQGRRSEIVMAIDVSDRMKAESDRIKLEEQLRQAQKMETVGRLAGGIAHDFNNLLAPIIGYSEMLLRDFAPGDTRIRQLRTVKEAAEKAANLTRQLLSFGRKQILEVRLIDLNKILTDFEKILRRTIHEDIDIIFKLAPSLYNMKGDPSQIEQIVMNLVVNAQDAMPSGGSIHVETSNCALDKHYTVIHPEVVPGSYVMLTVSDSGTGMDEETRKHIFEPFYTTKETGKGTGLGLATVYGIVQQHGGLINVYSEIGRGTSFQIYFPRAVEETTAELSEGVHSDITKGHETVMVVEDNELVRKMVCNMLSDHGYAVLESSGAQDCLTQFETHGLSIEILVTDVVMPVMNGKELYQRLLRKFPQLRALYMSGYPEDVVAHRGVLDKGIAFIQKPFTAQMLTSKIRDVLDSNLSA